MAAFSLSSILLSLTISLSCILGAHAQAKSVTFFGTQITLLFIHPAQWPVHLSVQHSQLEHTTKHVNCSITVQNFKPT